MRRIILSFAIVVTAAGATRAQTPQRPLAPQCPELPQGKVPSAVSPLKAKFDAEPLDTVEIGPKEMSQPRYGWVTAVLPAGFERNWCAQAAADGSLQPGMHRGAWPFQNKSTGEAFNVNVAYNAKYRFGGDTSWVSGLKNKFKALLRQPTRVLVDSSSSWKNGRGELWLTVRDTVSDRVLRMHCIATGTTQPRAFEVCLSASGAEPLESEKVLSTLRVTAGAIQK